MRGEQLKRIKKRERKKKARRKRSKENLGEGKGRMREMNWIKINENTGITWVT